MAIASAWRDRRTHGAVYCTLLFTGREGKVFGRHRKLKPTHAERTIWGEGDALGLRVYERPYGRISGLNCWEHNIVLPGYVLMAQGTQIHVASWPGREPTSVPPAFFSLWPRQLLLSRAFASQAGCYVICAAGMRLAEHVPKRYEEVHLTEHTGDSYILDPRGDVIVGPAKGETILTAKGSPEMVYAAKAACDVGGHYSRPDIFRLSVNGQPLERVATLEASDLVAAPTDADVVRVLEPKAGGFLSPALDLNPPPLGHEGNILAEFSPHIPELHEQTPVTTAGIPIEREATGSSNPPSI